MSDFVRWRTGKGGRGGSEDGGGEPTARELALIKVIHRYEAEMKRGDFASIPHDVIQALTRPSLNWRRVAAYTRSGMRFGIVIKPRASIETLAVPAAWQQIQQEVTETHAEARGDRYMKPAVLPEPVAMIGWWRDSAERDAVLIWNPDLSRRARREAWAALLGRQLAPVALSPAAIGLGAIGLLAALRRWACGTARAVPSTVALATSASVGGVAAITFTLAPAVSPFSAHVRAAPATQMAHDPNHAASNAGPSGDTPSATPAVPAAPAAEPSTTRGAPATPDGQAAATRPPSPTQTVVPSASAAPSVTPTASPSDASTPEPADQSQAQSGSGQVCGS